MRTPISKEVELYANKFYSVENSIDKNYKFQFNNHSKSNDYFNKDNKDLYILGISTDEGACGHYRLKLPLLYLDSLGIKVDLRLAPTNLKINLNLIANASHVIISRLVDKELFDVIRKTCNYNNTALIYDIDDNLLNISKDSPAYPYFDPETIWGKQNIENFKYCFENSDAAIYSTEYLKESIPHSDPHVIYNGIDVDLTFRNWGFTDKFNWRDFAGNCKYDSSTVCIGWSGSATHKNDLISISKVINSLLDENVVFALQCEKDLALDIIANHWKLPIDRFFLLPQSDFVFYPWLLSLFDIGLAPLVNNEFNKCKSWLKLAEYNALCIPYVASNIDPYNKYYRMNQGGIICDSLDEWENALRYLIYERTIAHSLAYEGKVGVHNNLSTSIVNQGLLYTLRTISENKNSVTKAPSYNNILNLFKD
jgi:hypothetical protein